MVNLDLVWNLVDKDINVDDLERKYFATMDRPIPGESLTSNPENPWPWEKPPQFTSVHVASEYIFSKLVDENFYPEMLDSLENDVPIMDITRVILFKGFTEGLWNPDLLLRLIEPVTYMILALAERALIDPVIYDEESRDDAIEEENVIFGKMESFDKFKETQEIPEGIIPKSVVAQQEQVPEGRSLLAREA